MASDEGEPRPHSGRRSVQILSHPGRSESRARKCQRDIPYGAALRTTIDYVEAFSELDEYFEMPVKASTKGIPEVPEREPALIAFSQISPTMLNGRYSPGSG
jgi:hypothetical protein